ncbi:hypothetical protein KCP69_25345 [Salmonella enterica subsp. enterica]|nr:hypothetical protein KCP69_25345 [Salmonella enterica subsp. enterica]
MERRATFRAIGRSDSKKARQQAITGREARFRSTGITHIVAQRFRPHKGLARRRLLSPGRAGVISADCPPAQRGWIWACWKSARSIR